MPTAPPTRRRWFQFGIGTMLVLVTAVAVVVWCTEDWWLGDPSDFVFVATIGGDRKTTAIVDRELSTRGIDYRCEGSVVYGVSVARRDAKRARQILHDSQLFPPGSIEIEYEDAKAP